MREEQREAAEFVRVHGLETGAEVRFLDLVSELGEFSKELLKSSEYGRRPITATEEMKEEMGDCIFSLLCLCNSLHLDAEEALKAALEKYQRRMERTGQAGSGR